MSLDVNTQRTDDGSVTKALPRLVYFMYSAGRIKIGYTADIYRRVSDLTNMGGSSVELIGVLPGDKDFERTLHRLFKADRTHGEWFKISDEIRRFLACIDDSCRLTMPPETLAKVGSCVERLQKAEAA